MIEQKADDVFNVLLSVMPNPWEKVVYHAGRNENKLNMIFYVKIHNRYISCFDLPKISNVTPEEISDAFIKLFSICFSENPEWNGFDFIATPDMKFGVNNYYEDVDTESEEWQNKCLRKTE